VRSARAQMLEWELVSVVARGPHVLTGGLGQVGVCCKAGRRR
jgi:hypothetical protein